ncbi:hypothetical protein [Streptomyces hydrogenans]
MRSEYFVRAFSERAFATGGRFLSSQPPFSSFVRWVRTVARTTPVAASRVESEG